MADTLTAHDDNESGSSINLIERSREPQKENKMEEKSSDAKTNPRITADQPCSTMSFKNQFSSLSNEARITLGLEPVDSDDDAKATEKKMKKLNSIQATWKTLRRTGTQSTFKIEPTGLDEAMERSSASVGASSDGVFKTRLLLLSDRLKLECSELVEQSDRRACMKRLLAEGTGRIWPRWIPRIPDQASDAEERKNASQIRHVRGFSDRTTVLEGINDGGHVPFLVYGTHGYSAILVLTFATCFIHAFLWTPFFWTFFVFSNEALDTKQKGEPSDSLLTVDVAFELVQLILFLSRMVSTVCNIELGVIISDITLVVKHLIANNYYRFLILSTLLGFLFIPLSPFFGFAAILWGIRIAKFWTLYTWNNSTSIDRLNHKGRMTVLIISVLIVNHVLACMWWLTFSYQLVDREDGSAFTPEKHEWEWWKRYAESLHDTSYMLFGSPPANTGRATVELLVSSIFGTVGQLYFAYVMAKLVEIISQMGILQARRNENTSIIEAAVKSLSLPQYLQLRIRFYIQFRNLNADEPVTAYLFDSLSQNLVTELKLQLFRWLVHSAPFFQDVPKVVINKIVVTFSPFVYTPGDIIIRAGEIGTHMYFILQGVVEVFIPNDSSTDDEDVNVVSTRIAGDYFGEIALIYQQLRSASIRSKSYSVLAHLSRIDLDLILCDFPRVRKQLVRRIMKMDIDKSKTKHPVDNEDDDDHKAPQSTQKDKPVEEEKMGQKSVGFTELGPEEGSAKKPGSAGEEEDETEVARDSTGENPPAPCASVAAPDRKSSLQRKPLGRQATVNIHEVQGRPTTAPMTFPDAYRSYFEDVYMPLLQAEIWSIGEKISRSISAPK